MPQTAKQKEWRNTPRGRFSRQRNRARSRGIEWLLTFGEWWAIWAPHWEKRGYWGHVTSRKGDKGPYAVGNVEILPRAENRAEQARAGRESKAKLTPAAVREIREQLASGLMQKTIATIYGVHSSVISRINTRSSYGAIQ